MQNVPFDVKMQGIVSMIRACAWALWLVGSLLLGGVVGTDHDKFRISPTTIGRSLAEKTCFRLNKKVMLWPSN